MKPVPIRLGDQFVRHGHILEILTIYQGGKVLKDWPRVTQK